MPLELLNYAFDELADVHPDFTYKDFSQDYLGRCSSYFSYLISTGRQPSADVLVNLWRHLNTEMVKTDLLLSYTSSEPERRNFSDRIDVYAGLCGEVFEALKERGRR